MILFIVVADTHTLLFAENIPENRNEGVVFGLVEPE